MKKNTSCLEIFLAVLLFVLLQLVFLPFVIMAFAVTSELIKHGWSFSDALNGGVGWPLYILDFVVSTILSG